ncbi:MAG: MoaD/ThiS family protein [Verrucomicrobia bacterium]|nr:MoaD/ThiS family protein [Verrucomicrobiota bacterium]
MHVRVLLHSYFKDLAGCATALEAVAAGSTLGQLLAQLYRRFPQLAAFERSTLLAVGVDYQTRDYVLAHGDEVSLFPPVQGG